MDQVPAQVAAFQDAMLKATQYMTTVHAYASAAGGARALKAHTDPYPVVVLQVNGTKEWTVCAPAANSTADVRSSAERALAYIDELSDGACKLHSHLLCVFAVASAYVPVFGGPRTAVATV